MASYYDEEQPTEQNKLFGSSDEMSDLDGDQASDNDETETAHIEREIAEEPLDTATEAPKPISKLPSFKKKTREENEEERARLEAVRREIRELKNNSSVKMMMMMTTTKRMQDLLIHNKPYEMKSIANLQKH
ncbi:unnamed protein product [Rhizopus microsporus]